MSEVFISHVEEDADLALEIAQGLERAGYTAWYYERDRIPGVPYLLQTGEAIESCRAFLLLISPDSLGSNQVTKEVERAHESGRPFIPVLRNVTHVEFQNRQPQWKQAVGTATSVAVTPAGAPALVPDIVRGLMYLDVQPGKQPVALSAGKPAVAPVTSPPPGLEQTRRSPTIRWAAVVAASVVALGLVVGLVLHLRRNGSAVPSTSEPRPNRAASSAAPLGRSVPASPTPAAAGVARVALTNGDSLTATGLQWGNSPRGWGFGYKSHLWLRQQAFEVTVPFADIKEASILWGKEARGHRYSDAAHKYTSGDEGYIFITRANGRRLEGLLYDTVYGTAMAAYLQGRDQSGNEFTVEVKNVRRIEFPNRRTDQPLPGPAQAAVTFSDGESRRVRSLRCSDKTSFALEQGPLTITVPFPEIEEARILWGKPAENRKFSRKVEKYHRAGYIFITKVSGAQAEGLFRDSYAGLVRISFTDLDGNEMTCFVTSVSSIRFLREEG